MDHARDAKRQREFEQREQRQRLDRIFLAVTNTPETYSAADTVAHMDGCRADDCKALANAIGYSHMTRADTDGEQRAILHTHPRFGWVGFSPYLSMVKTEYLPHAPGEAPWNVKNN